MRMLLPTMALLTACSDPVVSAQIDTTARVEVIEVAAPPLALERTLLATVEAAHDALITPMRPGRVVARPAPVGSRVSKGDAVLELDGREARANLQVARAAVTEAQAMVDDTRTQRSRVDALGEGASQAQRDAAALGEARASAALQRALGQRDLAAINLEYMTLRAPFDGEVALLEPEIGESVGAGTPAARVVDTTASRVVVGLLEDEVGAVQGGDTTFTLTAGGRSVPAALTHVAPAADPRTMDWRAELAIEGAPFPAGTPVNVTLRLPLTGSDGVVPASVVHDGALWVVREGAIVVTPVEVVGEAREGLLVRGVSVGTPVVLHAAESLQDGDKVVLLESP